MVRHDIALDELRRRIEDEKPGWLARANKQTIALSAGTGRTRFPRLWSEIKHVYITLQGSKCAFCEKWLEDDKIEHDVEHFRPKGRVDHWPVPRQLSDVGLTVSQPATGSEPGYRRLAYHPLNYIAACQKCNRVLKKNSFPIAGTRDVNGEDPAKMKGERAYMIYPISDMDDDPEQLITFHGLSPRARESSGFPFYRAQVTIRVFRLDDWRQRKELNKDRAEFLEKLFWALRQRDAPKSTKLQVEQAAQAITRLTSKTFRHANCLRSFYRLYESSHADAETIYDEVSNFLKTAST